MEEGPLLGSMSGPEEAMVPDLFGADGGFASENLPLKAPAVARAGDEEFHGLRDAYLGAADPTEPLLHAFNPPLTAACEDEAKAGLLVEGHEEDMAGEFPRLPELDPLGDAVLPAAPAPQAFNVHFLSPLRTPHGSPAVVPLGAWAREGAAHAGVRVIPVEVKEGGGAIPSEIAEEAVRQTPLSQEARLFPSSQEAEGASVGSHKDASPLVLCQLRGGTPTLRIDSSGAGDLRALRWAPPEEGRNDPPLPDGPRPVTALVGQLLPVPAKLNLITQQLGDGAPPSTVSGPAFPAGSALAGPPKAAAAGYCDCLASGDFGNNYNCNNCCNNLCHGIERFKTIKAKILCSSICKCIGCKNYEESPERPVLMAVPTHVEAGGAEGGLRKFRTQRRPSCISWEVVEATCACLLAQGEEAERARRPAGLAQQMVLEEFGRCLSQILHTEFKSKGLAMQ